MAHDKIVDWAFDELRHQLETRQTDIQSLNGDLAHVRRRLLAATTALQTIVRHDEMLSVPVKDMHAKLLRRLSLSDRALGLRERDEFSMVRFTRG